MSVLICFVRKPHHITSFSFRRHTNNSVQKLHFSNKLKNNDKDLLPQLIQLTPAPQVEGVKGPPAQSVDRIAGDDARHPVADIAQPSQKLYKRVLFDTNVLIEELSHMDEVRRAQTKVIRLKDKLIESGEHKRRILHQLAEIRRRLKEIHRDITDIGRGSERYITLIRDEMALLQEEKRIQTDYDRADEMERNLFTQLTAAINDSYEKEKIHSNTLRLWGLIGTIITSAITLILSTIGHYYHTTQLGLVGSKFSNAESLANEIRLLKEMFLEMRREQAERKLIDGESQKKLESTKNVESWSGYFSRHISNVYRYFVPKKT